MQEGPYHIHNKYEYNGIGGIYLLKKPSRIIIYNFLQISETKGRSRKSQLYALDSSIVRHLNLQIERIMNNSFDVKSPFTWQSMIFLQMRK